MTPVNLERQIKRHVLARRHLFYAVTAPGFEGLCADELAPLAGDLRIEAVAPGGVLFSGRLQALYAANLHLRTAGRVLMRLAQFKATNFRQLEKKIGEVAWHYYLPGGCLPGCRVTSHQSRLYHTQAVTEHTLQAIGAVWRDNGVEPAGEQEQTLYIRIQQDLVTVSLDSSGPNLYRRGLKIHATTAPLRETMAAAILQMAGYDPGRPLIDPMCGGGTVSLEAALRAKQIPAGALRDFAFMGWPGFREPQWRHLTTTALEGAVTFTAPMIFASDVDEAACEQLLQCIARHHLDDVVRVGCSDFFSLPPWPGVQGGAPGLIVLNPPYGRRLMPDQGLTVLFRQIGRKLKADFKGWQVALLAPRSDLARQIPFALKTIPITHGGLALTLLLGRVG